MNPAMTPQEWDAEWTRLAEEERDWKFANHAAIELAKIYARLDDDRKPAIDALLGRWVLGDPPGREFEAESLIRQFGILEALPAVRSARDACGTADAQSRGRREMLGVIIRELESLDPR